MVFPDWGSNFWHWLQKSLRCRITVVMDACYAILPGVGGPAHGWVQSLWSQPTSGMARSRLNLIHIQQREEALELTRCHASSTSFNIPWSTRHAITLELCGILYSMSLGAESLQRRCHGMKHKLRLALIHLLPFERPWVVDCQCSLLQVGFTSTTIYSIGCLKLYIAISLIVTLLRKMYKNAFNVFWKTMFIHVGAWSCKLLIPNSARKRALPNRSLIFTDNLVVSWLFLSVKCSYVVWLKIKVWRYSLLYNAIYIFSAPLLFPKGRKIYIKQMFWPNRFAKCSKLDYTKTFYFHKRCKMGPPFGNFLARNACKNSAFPIRILHAYPALSSKLYRFWWLSVV